MPEYLVTWEINVWADDPVEAARKARDIQRDFLSAATEFVVREMDYDDVDHHQDVTIDLTEE